MKRLGYSKYIMLLAGFAALVIVSCDGTDGTDIDFASAPSSGVTVEGAIIEVEIHTIWEADSVEIDHNFQETGTTTCYVTAASPVGTCTLSVPEYQMHRSYMLITYSADDSTCGSLGFTPFRYLASNNAAYTPPGETTTTDCSGTNPETEADCWGGFAPQVVPDFPNFTGLVVFPSVTDGIITATSQVLSPFNYGYYDSPDAGVSGSNRLLTNDYTGVLATDINFNGADDTQESYIGTYAGGTNPYAEYTFTCLDVYGEDSVGYQLNLEITDDDGTTNEYNSFKEY